jgi:hypothetical protein
VSERARAASPSGFSTAVEAARRSAPLLASVSRVVQRRGEALAPADRAFFEPRFGRDLSHVRVHRGDADARNTAGSLNSAAYTVGSHIVLGAEADAGGYGRRVLAHELAHVEQHQLQSGGTTGIHIGEPTDLAETQADSRASEVMQTAPRAFARGDPVAASSSGVLRRWSLKESAHKALERIKGAFDPRTRQFASDLWASIKESPSHLGEFFSDELLPSIQAHLPSVIGVTLGLLGAEAIIGGLEATPTGVTQIVGAILEVIVVAVLGYFAAVETSGAVDEAMHWVRQAKEANGDPKQITEASRSFVRMLWHIFMAVLTIAGVRARLKGGALGRIKAPFEEPPPPSTPPELRAFRGGKSGPVPMENGKVVSPRYRGTDPSSNLGRGSGSSGPRSEGTSALKSAPEVAPDVRPAPRPVPDVEPAPAAKPTLNSGRGPRVRFQVLVDTAAGVSRARPQPKDPEKDKKKRPPFILWLPPQKAAHLATYRSWLGTLQSDPGYERGNPPQRRKWHEALRIGGSYPLPAEVYARGHALGLQGKPGERRIRIPDWTKLGSPVSMEVDHIVELQVTPPPMRSEFDSIFNYELLDRDSNGKVGPRLNRNIRRERARQEAFDPTTIGKVLKFEAVEVEGAGPPGLRWLKEELHRGEQLDSYERYR